MKNYREKLKNIKAFVFDYDGVLTNGNIFFDVSGLQLRQAYVRDGYALQLAQKKGFHIAIMTGSHDKGIFKRLETLNINNVYLASEDKEKTFNTFLKTFNLNASEIIFMGDDIPDYEVMKLAGISTCPIDACEEIKSVSDYISPFGGGKGCVRDIVEQVLKINNIWMNSDTLNW